MPNIRLTDGAVRHEARSPGSAADPGTTFGKCNVYTKLRYVLFRDLLDRTEWISHSYQYRIHYERSTVVYW